MFKNNTINMRFTQSIFQQLQKFSLETKSGVLWKIWKLFNEGK